jgi:PglZ domain
VEGAMRQDEVFRTQVRPRATAGKTAYLLVDALRYEMGQELLEGLGDGFDSALRPAIGQLPTITEVSMAALMPASDEGMELVDVGAGKVGIEVGDTLLKDRASRVKHFQTLLGNAQWPISNALGVRITSSMSAVSLALKRSMPSRYPAYDGLTSSLCVRPVGHSAS